MGQFVDPVEAGPMFPWTQDVFEEWLAGLVIPDQGAPGVGFYGASQYNPAALFQPETLYPDINQTRLPEVFQNWQPWDAGTQWLAQALSENWLGVGQPSNLSKQAWEWGGMGGPGHKATVSQMQYGAPSSEAGQYAANMAQFGVPSAGAGQPLVDMAYGSRSPNAGILEAFMNAPTYKSPPIPRREVTRNA